MIATILFGLAATVAAGFLVALARNAYLDFRYERAITAKDPTAVLLGTDDRGRQVFLKQKFRTMHAQIIGTTSAGKTESLVLPWAIKDIENGSGCLIIDGKSDRAFLDKLHGYVVRAGREKDFRLCSLAYSTESATFNPLIGGSVQEVAERVFSSFTIENEYYRSVQFKAFTQLLLLLEAQGERPTMSKVYDLVSSHYRLTEALKGFGEGHEILERVSYLAEMQPAEMRQVLSGLDATLSHFTAPAVRRIFDAETPDITLDGAMAGSQILYFQLPSMYLPILASMTGKLVLQCLQSAIAKRHLALASGDLGFFSVFLDDFQDYIYEGFASLLNKSRSANVGVVFSHQALGDLDKVGPAFRNVVLTNTNVKCVMRGNDPDSCEYFSKSFGTTEDKKTTQRQTRNLFGTTVSPEGSVRDVERFRYHPNAIKNLRLGEGIVSIPHPRGVKVTKVRFQRRPDLPTGRT